MLTVSDSSAEQLLQDLVAIPSPSCHEREAAAFLTSWMGRNGYDDAFIDEAGNAVGIIGSGRRQIVLLGHIDTYVGFPPVRLQDRILYGRGSVDAKGPLCTFAASASSAKLAANVQVIVIGAVEEEAATSRGARHALTQYQPEYCVIGEPSRWDRITLGYKGRLLLDWRWEGGLTHSAGEAPSPAERALAYWQDIKIHCDQVNAGIGTLFARLDPSIRDINTWQEGVNGVAEMTVGFRLPPDLAPGDVLRRFPAGDGATVSGRGAECAFSGERNSELSRLFRRAIRVEGGRPRFVYKTGTSDMNIVGPRWGCPIVAYGPGDSVLDHRPDEHLNLDEYLRAIDVMIHVLETV